ncbi:hypothetical protein V6N13_113715 [Hibiscus sabdariffa]|uniref:GH18 domain-containing protein n=2 Tax=Hibiscus sabdariffa TaxID=183260 RepID=A0ABR1ZJP9_9ROSI
MLIQVAPANSNLFQEYIGAEFNDIKSSDVPINSTVEFDFILLFSIDYNSSSSHTTNGKFNVKVAIQNVKVALNLGCDSVGNDSAYFNPPFVDSWVSNVVSSLTDIIQQYNLDMIDIYYEHFNVDPDTFA